MPINVNKTFEEKYVRTKNKDENIILECLRQRQNERTMNHTSIQGQKLSSLIFTCVSIIYSFSFKHISI